MYLTNQTQKYLEDKIIVPSEDMISNIFNQFKTDIDKDYEISDFVYNELQYLSDENEDYKIESEIEQHGGEGEGDNYWVITRVLNKKTNEVFYIRFYGYYSSWDGTTWNGWDLVKPHKKEIIEFY